MNIREELTDILKRYCEARSEDPKCNLYYNDIAVVALRYMDRRIGLEGNGWFDDDPEALTLMDGSCYD